MDNKCTGECIRCSFQQQTYCAAQYGHAIMAVMPAIIERLDMLNAKFGQAEIFNPLKEDGAQKTSGANSREAETN